MKKKTKKTRKGGKKKPIKKRMVRKRSLKKKPAKKKARKVVKKKPAKKKQVKKVVRKKKRPVLKQQEPNIFEGVHRAKIRIIGIGGGGGSIISEILPRINKADFLAINTDARALGGLNRKIKKIQFGQNLTKGLGTGMNIELGEQYRCGDRSQDADDGYHNHQLCESESFISGKRTHHMPLLNNVATHFYRTINKISTIILKIIYINNFSFLTLY